jgi:hypothetical protein
MDVETNALRAEILLLGGHFEEIDTGDGSGVLVECLLCADANGTRWRFSNYPAGAFRAYADHVRAEHRP